MRLTCLKCGHQMEVATGPRDVRINCVCGQDYSYPEVLNTGTEPNEYAAERSRSKAFRAAGVVKNVGGFALGIALLGILFFPIGLLGAGIGIYCLTMLRGPLGRYSGRRAAVAAVVIGSAVFLGEGAFAMSWLKARRVQRIMSIQASVSEDLRALLRAQRLFRATHDTYGTFREFRFRPPAGAYTYYLGVDDLVEATRDSETITDPLPEELIPAVTETAFTAIAVANLDGDPFVDAWSLNDHGTITHLADDATNLAVSETEPEEVATPDETLDAAALEEPAEPPPAEPAPAEPASEPPPPVTPAPVEPKPEPKTEPKIEPPPAPEPNGEAEPKPEPEPTPKPDDSPQTIDDLLEGAPG